MGINKAILLLWVLSYIGVVSAVPFGGSFNQTNVDATTDLLVEVGGSILIIVIMLIVLPSYIGMESLSQTNMVVVGSIFTIIFVFLYIRIMGFW